MEAIFSPSFSFVANSIKPYRKEKKRKKKRRKKIKENETENENENEKKNENLEGGRKKKQGTTK